MKMILMAALAALTVTGCTSRDDRIAFDGQYYRTKLTKVDGQRHVFQVTARPVSASLQGAREAARYEAVSYCVTEYGSSDIAWVISPDAEASRLVVRDDTLTLQGACPQ
ncbi:hypothetical protein [Sulfitobacter sabulilitoris]|uniref:Lipoprotein n=1 Tax=Sulfitobacter sabulilitoris TaxID=2562655 RepID=A0A5S3PKJ2_9RHOB|nr:hypothetical protein [Sulfitobacter sabulilitoris]TMM54944.1 hypothetical protein FDT80_05035 [Sulfitobacter sabulilitoris]